MNTRTKCVVGSGCALLLAGAASAATTWKVSTAVTDGMTGPQQITNALTQCASGDTILIDPGTYDFTGIYMDAANKIHLTRKDNPIATFSLVGNTESHWVEGGGGGSLLFTGDGQLGDFSAESGKTGWRGAYPVIANIGFSAFKPSNSAGGALRFGNWAKMQSAWPIVTNCVFRNCSAASGGAVFGGAKVVDCQFVGNTAKDCGGALYGGSAYGSSFETNSAAFGGAIGIVSNEVVILPAWGYQAATIEVSNCVFQANATTQSSACKGGGALYFTDVSGRVMDSAFYTNKIYGIRDSLGGAIVGDREKPVVIERCHFEGNASGYSAGAVGYGVVSNSTFKENFAAAAGGAVYACKVSGSSFDGDCIDLHGITGLGLYVGEATLYGDNNQPGATTLSELTDCTVRGAICQSSATRCVFQDVNFAKAYAVFYNQNWVTNSLITGCGANLRGIAYYYGSGVEASEFVNCTFVNNTPDWYWGMFTTSSNGANPVRAVNCIFTGTVDSHGKAADLTGRNLKAGDVKLDHCAYGSADEAFADCWTNVDGSSFVWAKPRFAKGGGYQLRPSSPLRGKGLTLNWTADDLDLADNPRVREGKVDLGCYQCWTDSPGVLFLVR